MLARSPPALNILLVQPRPHPIRSPHAGASLWVVLWQMIPDQLAAGIRVLIYAGDQDYICNWLGNQAWTQAMPWPHQAEFNTTAPVEWQVAGKPAGTLQTSNGFSFLRVYDAGHMVPLDQPERALAMANAFMRNTL